MARTYYGSLRNRMRRSGIRRTGRYINKAIPAAWRYKAKRRMMYRMNQQMNNVANSLSNYKKRIYRPPAVSGRMKLKGMVKPLDNRPELKWLFYQRATMTLTAITDTDLNKVWSNNGTDNVTPTPVRYYTFPTQGVSQNQCIGNTYNSLYASVTFWLDFKPGTSNRSTDLVRVYVIREKEQNQSYTKATVFRYPATGSLFVPITADIDSKVWDIQYDKLFPVATGYTTASSTSLLSPPKRFRLVIPIKNTMSLSTTDSPFPKSIYVGVTSGFGTVNMNNIQATYYFRDP